MSTSEGCLPNETFYKNENDKSSPIREACSQRRERFRVVIKIGTSTLMEDNGNKRLSFCLSNIGKLVDVVCQLRSSGFEVLLVSSGAVGAGCVSMHLKTRPDKLSDKQAIAAVGQCRLMRLYEDLFSVREVRVAQLLVSRNDFMRQRNYTNFRNCLRSLMDMEVVPILNENDSICTEELRFGDNDTLAAHCAVAIDANFLFFLTDVDCLYTQNPNTFPDSRPVWFVDSLTEVYDYLFQPGGQWGTGGMYTKVVASKIATNLGVHVAVVNGNHPRRIIDILKYTAKNKVDLVKPDDGPSKSLSVDVFPDSQETRDCSGEQYDNSKSKTLQQDQVSGGSDDGSDKDEEGKCACSSANYLHTGIFGGAIPSNLSDGNKCGSMIAKEENMRIKPFFEHDKPQELSKHRMQHEQQRELPQRILEGGQLKSEIWRRPDFCFRYPKKGSFEKPPFVGTIFVAQPSLSPLCHFQEVRRWMLALPVRGAVYVDEESARNLVMHRKSLFAAGIRHVSGTFLAGECISVYLYGFNGGTKDAGEVARCLSGFSSRELDIIIGRRGDEIEAMLGYSIDEEVSPHNEVVLVYMNGHPKLKSICEGQD